MRSCATPTAAPMTSILDRSTGRASDRRGRERRRLPRLGRRDRRHRARPRLTQPMPLGDEPDDYPRRGCARAVERLLLERDQRPLRPGARPRAVPARRRDAPSTAAIRCSSTCARSSTGRSSGRRASGARSSSALRGGDFVLDSGQDLAIGYDSHDDRASSGSTSKRASASTWPRPRLRSSSSRSEPSGGRLGDRPHADHLDHLARLAHIDRLGFAPQ